MEIKYIHIALFHFSKMEVDGTIVVDNAPEGSMNLTEAVVNKILIPISAFPSSKLTTIPFIEF
jgi:hypothetical protein